MLVIGGGPAGSITVWNNKIHQVQFSDFGYTRLGLHVERDIFDDILLNETGLYYAIDKHSFNISKKKTRERKMITVSIVSRIKCALVLIIFILIPLLPITGTLGLFIVIFRPIWFKKLVDNVYADKNDR